MDNKRDRSESIIDLSVFKKKSNSTPQEINKEELIRAITVFEQSENFNDIKNELGCNDAKKTWKAFKTAALSQFWDDSIYFLEAMASLEKSKAVFGFQKIDWDSMYNKFFKENAELQLNTDPLSSKEKQLRAEFLEPNFDADKAYKYLLYTADKVVNFLKTNLMTLKNQLKPPTM